MTYIFVYLFINELTLQAYGKKPVMLNLVCRKGLQDRFIGYLNTQSFQMIYNNK